MTNDTLNIQIKEKTLKLLDKTNGNICPHCLGRIFSHDLEGTDNQERGNYILKTLSNTFKDSNDPSDCFICGNIFDKIDEELTEYITDELENLNLEFSTFLVGCRIDKDMIPREKEIHEKLNVDVENIKKEINREIGKALSTKMCKEVDFDHPNLVILVDFTKNSAKPHLKFQINPLFLEGRYKKLVRGIPQTKWPCRECKGRGCERCNYTGKMYQESVEELISPLVLKEAGGTESKFHGAGREDIDVLMLGTGRPFVLEIKEPHLRDLDLKDLEDRVNRSAAGKVEVLNLKFADKKRRSEIKTSSTDTYKVYHAKVQLENNITSEELHLIKSLNMIEQRTPLRVVHRRADKIRRRKIRNIEIKTQDEKYLELIIECQGGLYIKELISGDDNRTNPSISSLLKTQANCVQLDVLDVHID